MHAVTLTAVTQPRVAASVIQVGWELRVNKNVTWVRLVMVAVPSAGAPTVELATQEPVNVDADPDGSDQTAMNLAHKVTTGINVKKNATARTLMDAIMSQENVCAPLAGVDPHVQKHA